MLITRLHGPRLPDAVRIKQNISVDRITVHETNGRAAKGEEAALRLCQSGCFDAVASDDARFIRQLRVLGVPYAVPAVIIVRLCREGALTADLARKPPAALRPHISSEQRAAALLMISGGIES